MESGKSEIIVLNSKFAGQITINLSELYPDDFSKFTKDNFVIQIISTYIYAANVDDVPEGASGSNSSTISLNYDSTTGILNVNVPTTNITLRGNGYTTATATVYASILLIK